MSHTRDIIDYLLPHIITAGKYSAAIQDRVGAHTAKDGSTPFHQALSDADITIQSFFEVALLARFPQVSFFSEEQESSLNTDYFPQAAEYEVLLDPIDGTRAYIDNRTAYQVIVAIHDRSRICGSLVYVPRRNEIFLAVRGEGARILSEADVANGLPGRTLRVQHDKGPVLVFNNPEIVTRLQSHLDVRDLIVEYEQGSDGFNSLDLLRGRAAVVVLAPSQAIDGGALAFIAQEAGAIVTDNKGNEVASYRDNSKRVLPCVVAAVNQEWHQKVLMSLDSFDFQKKQWR